MGYSLEHMGIHGNQTFAIVGTNYITYKSETVSLNNAVLHLSIQFFTKLSWASLHLSEIPIPGIFVIIFSREFLSVNPYSLKS